jgi:3-isopropylmalate/(R)-2-methylmalate dehydratase small subunit
VEVDLARGEITNVSKGKVFQAQAYPDFIVELVSAGGLVEHTKRRLGDG